MGIAQLALLACGLSMDAFAASIGIGLSCPGTRVREAATTGVYFGAAQAIMPALGYLAAKGFAGAITAWDHWIAFGLLSFLGVRMIISALKKEESGETRGFPAASRMLMLALATSIDAMAAGVSLAFLGSGILIPALFIGAFTFSLSFAGVKAGRALGAGMKARAEAAGGAVLVGIGLKILIEHLLA